MSSLNHDVLVSLFSYMYCRPSHAPSLLSSAATVCRAWWVAAHWVLTHPHRGARKTWPHCLPTQLLKGYCTNHNGHHLHPKLLAVTPTNFDRVIRMMIHPTMHGGILLSLHTSDFQTVLLDSTSGLEALQSSLRALGLTAHANIHHTVPLLPPTVDPSPPLTAAQLGSLPPPPPPSSHSLHSPHWVYMGAETVAETISANHDSIVLLAASRCARVWERGHSRRVCLCGAGNEACRQAPIGIFVGDNVSATELETFLEQSRPTFLFAVTPPSHSITPQLSYDDDDSQNDHDNCHSPSVPGTATFGTQTTMAVPTTTIFSTFSAQIYILPLTVSACTHIGPDLAPTYTVSEPGGCRPTTTEGTQTDPPNTIAALPHILAARDDNNGTPTPLYVILSQQDYPTLLHMDVAPRYNHYALLAASDEALALDYAGGAERAAVFGTLSGVDANGVQITLLNE
ncbi:hypothetical protein DFJ77DRAFT_456525 [Powellomyces hirtus]|nr:hypothetical protein DFJ77DRAFT_456525 [Powellomyces hirtus]